MGWLCGCCIVCVCEKERWVLNGGMRLVNVGMLGDTLLMGGGVLLARWRGWAC